MPNVQTRKGSVDGVEVTPSTIHMDTEDASQGRKTGRVRYILAISLAAAVLAMAVVYFIIHSAQA